MVDREEVCAVILISVSAFSATRPWKGTYASEPRNAPPVNFAHPSERRSLACWIFYRRPLEYEPRSFPLEWNAEGSPTHSFTPDFYLPDYDLFLEITTIKPRSSPQEQQNPQTSRTLPGTLNIKLY